MRRIKTFYDELGLDRDATASEIKLAFKEIAKNFHPDKNPPDKQAWAHEQMSRLNFVKDTLLDPDSRKEYDALVHKYETMPSNVRHRRPREQHAIEREYARVSVEIMNLAGKYSNCRLKMAIGAVVGAIAAVLHLSTFFTEMSAVFDRVPLAYPFTYFFTLMGAVMIVMGVIDYLGRDQYRQRIDELEQRRSYLRQRMFEAYVSY